jgi:hypothetical protein
MLRACACTISTAQQWLDGYLFYRKGKAMPELPKRALGRTGLQVTMLGDGAIELRGAPRGRDVTEAQAETILHAVLDAGINYIDTSASPSPSRPGRMHAPDTG